MSSTRSALYGKSLGKDRRLSLPGECLEKKKLLMQTAQNSGVDTEPTVEIQISRTGSSERPMETVKYHRQNTRMRIVCT